ncbi:MAG: hypothetical protein ACFHWX_07805 [Bacteroidota bacterium]
MRYQTLYCTRRALEGILDNTDSEIFKVLTDYSKVKVRISEEEFDDLINEDPYFNDLLKMIPSDFFPYENEGELEAFDIRIDDDLDRNALSSSTGFLHLCSSDDKIPLTTSFPWNFTKGEKYIDPTNNQIKCWEFALKEIKDIHFNSIVISDNYLFTGSHPIDNLKGIFKGLLNRNLKSELHISIFAENGRNQLTRQKIYGYYGTLLAFIKTLVDVEIRLQIILHTDSGELHERLIITNYQSIQSNQGYTKFDTSKGLSIIDNHSELFHHYHALDLGSDRIRMKYINRELRKRFNVFNKLMARKEIKNDNVFIVGSEEINRLFSSLN